jgi:hypothetical protein
MRPLLAPALALVAAAACADSAAPPTPRGPDPVAPDPGTRPRGDTVTPGSSTPVDPGATPGTTRGGLPLSDPAMTDGHVGRGPRRLTVTQLRAALESAIGVSWRQRATILSADYATGSYVDENADMLALLARTLGQPDYNTSTQEAIDPTAVFSKLAGDGIRKACRDGIALDAARPRGQRILVRHVETGDTAATNPAGVRQNLSYLALRFWARSLAPESPEVTALFDLFRLASTAPAVPAESLAAATPLDGWRAVCVALATDPQFLTY